MKLNNSQILILVLPFVGPIFADLSIMKSNKDKKYDLEERTFVFAKNVIE